MARTVDAIAGMVDEARQNDVEEIAAVGTAGLRIAPNRDDLIEAVRHVRGVEVEVIPGVTAALAAAARVGAPLADDWASLSLSDLNLPWETVARRLSALAASGIALALYNPRSRTRPLERALEVLREHRAPDTPVIVATDVARPDESIVATTLGALDPQTVTMRSLLLVAGDTSRWAGRWLIASRAAA